MIDVFLDEYTLLEENLRNLKDISVLDYENTLESDVKEKLTIRNQWLKTIDYTKVYSSNSG